MSKKVFQSREHRERAQPANRTRLGLLEKHKDYVQRARNYHAKQARILALRRQAAGKNPDEFYFAMQRARKTKQGQVVREQEFERMPGEVIKLLKSQDLAYVQEMLRKESKKLAALATAPGSVSHARSSSSSAGHVKFIEDDEDLAALVHASTANPQCAGAGAGPEPPVAPCAELEARRERLRLLQLAERKLTTQNAAMSRGRKRKVGQDAHGIPVFKWDQERKK